MKRAQHPSCLSPNKLAIVYTFPPLHGRTVCPANLAPNDSRSLGLAAGSAVNVCDALSKVPLRIFIAVDALKREEADVGVRVAFAALVADVAALDVDCEESVSVLFLRHCACLRRWLFSVVILEYCDGLV